jgi:uncharacterized protein YbaP (TraB family)
MTLAKRLKSSVSNLAQGAVGVAAGLALVFAIAGAPTQVLAQAAPAPAAPAAAPAIQGQGPALWVIKDADSTLYLFGSVHVLRPTTGWASPRVNAAFDSASDVWFEITNPEDQAAMMPLIQQYGLSPQTPLSSRLTPEEVAQLDVAAKTIGASAAQLDPLKPWLAALSLSVAPLVKAGYDPQSGVELALKARAQAAGKRLHGFETLEKQVGMLATLPDDVQLEFLRETLKDFDEAVEMLDSMVEAWAKGDVEGLDRIVVEEMKTDAPELYKVLLVDRNPPGGDCLWTGCVPSKALLAAASAAAQARRAGPRCASRPRRA